jgi:hypothetical protein
MSHFAHINNGVVDRVIVAEHGYIQSLPDSSEWVQTSYNTKGGVHYGQDGKPDGKDQLGFNFAGNGMLWDGIGFFSPSPFPSWVLNKTTYLWNPPVPKPKDDKKYKWDESTISWVVS